MPNNSTLITEIRNVVGALSTLNINNSSAANDVYEVYLFTLIISAAVNEGATIQYLDRNGIPTTSLIFRSSPGYINSSIKNYSYAKISFNGCPELEAHISVRVSGQSTVLHESDISVLLTSEADLCRLSPDRVAPRSSKLVVSIEAKYYTTNLGLHLGRSFLGLTTDFSAQEIIFITNSSSDSITKLLSRKKKSWEHQISPNNANDVSRLLGTFQKAFKNFKAKQ